MAGVFSPKKINEIVERIYAASCDPALWPDVSLECHRLFPQGAFSLLISTNGTLHDPIPTSAGWDPEFIRKYKEYYHKINTYEPILHAVPPGKVVRASEVISKEWRDKQVFFHEWLKPAGNFTHAASVTLVRSRGTLTRVSYDLPERFAEFEPDVAETLRHIGPHFLRALEITSRLHGAALVATAFEALIENIESAAIVIDRSRKIVSANNRAIALMKSGRVIREQLLSRLAFIPRTADEAFMRALRNCSEMPHGPATSTFTVDVAEDLRSPVHVLPLRMPVGAAGAEARLLLVLITVDRKVPAPPIDALRATYGLSAREAEVALQTANGSSARQVAERLGVRVPTVRNQLAAAMAKLGVHQPDCRSGRSDHYLAFGQLRENRSSRNTSS